MSAANGSGPLRVGLDVPAELVEQIAQRTAELVAERAGGAERAEAVRANGRLALTRTEAAEAIGVSVDHFERHVLTHLRTVAAGRLRLIPVAELEAWLEGRAARALEPRR